MRLIANMQIENDVIRVVEVPPFQQEYPVADFLHTIPGVIVPTLEDRVMAEWLALCGDRLVGAGVLVENGAIQMMACEVDLQVAVHVDYRGFGLGKLMIRTATDLAIRHRRRLIVALVAQVDLAAITVLDFEDFEPDPIVPGSLNVVYKKVLKWQ